MMRSLIIASTVLLGGCNVFYGVGGDDSTSEEPAKVCDGDACEVACSGCDTDCESDTTCSGTVDDGTIACAEDATCELGCTGGTCEFSCTDRDSSCFVDCADEATCRLLCGTERNLRRLGRCIFVNCENPTFCGDGVAVCNGDC